MRITFSPQMLAAIRAGQKTQTRRIFRPALRRSDWATHIDARSDGVTRSCWGEIGDAHSRAAKVYGITGDTLAVAEPCWLWGRWKTVVRKRESVILSVDVRYDAPLKGDLAPRDGSREGWVIRQGRYAPNWTVRMSLRVTNWRVERVQQISEADARAEGVADREAYKRLWDDLNAGREYCDWRWNPWVVVREFEVAHGS